MRRLLDLSRAGEWWHHKVPIALATGYAAAHHVDESITDAAGRLALGVFVLAAGATYVSLLNDLTDIEADRAAGKANRLAGRSRGAALAATGATLAVGVVLAVVVWQTSRWAAAATAGAYLAFTLYSLPPVRLKGRGILGAIADACGAHVAPQLLLLALMADGHGPADWWVGAVAVWALAFGLRGALWHQLGDVEADTRAGVRTFGAAHPGAARTIVRSVVFPVELAALAAVLAGVDRPLVVIAAVAVYTLVEWLRVRYHRVRIVVTERAPRYRIALQELYSVVLPIALLVEAPLVLLTHVALFPVLTIRLVVDVVRAARSTPASKDLGHPTVGQLDRST